MDSKQVIDKVQETMNEWVGALVPALTKAGHKVTVTGRASGISLINELLVSDEAHGYLYKILMRRKLIVKGGQRFNVTSLEVYNPHGGLHVHMTGFAPEKVTKIVGYASQYIASKTENDKKVEAKRQRNGIARRVLEDSRVELPDWVEVIANVDKDEDVGTFILSFREHRTNYPMKRVTPQQISKILRHIKEVLDERTADAIEKDLAAKLAEHEGRA